MELSISFLVGYTPALSIIHGRAEAARRRLRQVLNLIGHTAFPIHCVYAVCSNVRSIIAADPPFAAEVYRRVFGYQESSEEQTQMGGIVLPMLSNRRQDYQMCYYNLIEKFDAFLARSSEEAVAAGIDALTGIIVAEHIQPNLERGATLETLEEHFDFAGQRASTLTTLVTYGTAELIRTRNSELRIR